MVSGEFELIVEVLCKDRDDLATFLNLKLLHDTGITRSETFITLRTYKIAQSARPTIPRRVRLQDKKHVRR